MHPLPIQSLPAQRIPPLPAAAMLRSQRIPTRLEVGYMGDVYHAWISIYTKETGWVNGIIEFDGKNWELMDPTFASSSKSPKNFTSENSKYTTNFDKTGDDDFSFAIPGVSRFRVSTFKQRGSYSAVIRVISFTLPQPSELHIPDAVMNLADSRRGMVLVTGPAGSGKSTTLACLIDRINHEREDHIITLEDPLEFLHPHEKGIVSQREISTDTESYAASSNLHVRSNVAFYFTQDSL